MKLCWFQLQDRLLGCVSNDKEISPTAVHMHNSSTLQDEVYQAINVKIFHLFIICFEQELYKKKTNDIRKLDSKICHFDYRLQALNLKVKHLTGHDTGMWEGEWS